MIYDFLLRKSMPYGFPEAFLFVKYNRDAKEAAAKLAVKCLTPQWRHLREFLLNYRLI